jgi:gliding motility-associated lipoprotein GldD
MRHILFCLLIVGITFCACKPDTYVPKPRGYSRIDTPQHAYQLFDSAGFPYAFEYPVYGRVAQDSTMAGSIKDNPYSMNIDFPELGGTIYLSYKTIDAGHPLSRLLDDAHDMSFWHNKRADYINSPSFHTPNDVHGIMYSVGGNAASAYQFFATDSSRHFLRGALYFNVSPNADSLKPLTEFLRADMERMIGTLRWKSGNSMEVNMQMKEH